MSNQRAARDTAVHIQEFAHRRKVLLGGPCHLIPNRLCVIRPMSLVCGCFLWGSLLLCEGSLSLLGVGAWLQLASGESILREEAGNPWAELSLASCYRGPTRCCAPEKPSLRTRGYLLQGQGVSTRGSTTARGLCRVLGNGCRCRAAAQPPCAGAWQGLGTPGAPGRGAAEYSVHPTRRSVLQETTAHIPQVTIQIVAPRV